MKKMLVVILALLLGLGSGMLPMASISPVSADDGVVTLDEVDNGSAVDLQGDQELVIDLEGNLSTGYLWEVVLMDGAILQQVGQFEFRQYADVVGSAGRQTLRFRAVGEGRTDLALAYRRPWEDGTPLRMFSVGVRTAGPITPIEDVATPVAPPSPPRDLGPISSAGLASAHNWCALGGCTPVKNQGSCGSCWAFATVGVVESLIKLDDGVTRDIAEQYLVSCNIDGWGCNGGTKAFDYFINRYTLAELAAGAVYEADYPYTSGSSGQTGTCTGSPHTKHEKLISWDYVAGGAEYPTVAQIKQAIQDYGPVYVSICAGPAFSAYGGGVFSTHETSYCLTHYGSSTNHAVVLVGWDDSQGASGVWYLRNSWGTSWGEPLAGAPPGDGYMRIAYGTSNVGRWPAYAVYGNSPPYTPGNPSPANGATDQSRNVDLGWTGGDPDAGDTVTYTVRLGTTNPPPPAPIPGCNGISSATCDPGTLSYYTRYYWQVVATDQDGASTTGPVWNFRTVSAAGPLVYDGHMIDDDSVGQSSGDGDGIAECGEIIEIDVDLYNQGITTTTGITAAFSSGDFYVTWLDGASNYPNISAGGTGTNSDSLVFEVHPLASDGHVVQFNLQAGASNGGPWSDTFTLTLACDVEHPTRYLPLVVRDAGFDSQFKGSAPGWEVHSGSWAVDSEYYWTYGVADLISSASYNASFTDLDYSVRLWRGGCETCANRLYVRGTPYPLRSYNEWNSAYLFQYARDGYYSVWKVVNGSFTALQNWTFTSAVNQDSAWNTLRVVANGSSLYFYINGTLVWSGSDSSLAAGRVGIGMYRDATSTGNLFRVDWARLSVLDGAVIADEVSPEQQALNEAANRLGGGSPDYAPPR